MKLYLLLSLCIMHCVAVREAQRDDPAADLQKEIQDYLRRLKHQQQTYTTNNMKSVLNGMLQYPQPSEDESAEESYQARSEAGAHARPIQSNPLPGALARSYSSSSVSVKRPRTDGDGDSVLNEKLVEYSSVRDVDDEEHLGEKQGTSMTDSGDTKITSKQTFKTVAEPLARKADSTSEQHQNTETMIQDKGTFSDVYFVAIVAGCCAAGIFGVISAGICFYRLQKSSKAAADVEYPAYGVTGPSKDMSSPNGDRKLAQSAQMYHYQHQKQQMIAVEKAGSTKNTSASDVDSEEENEEGDYTVYECPGLAPTGEMEVKNPLFHDDSTPVSPPVVPAKLEHQNN